MLDQFELRPSRVFALLLLAVHLLAAISVGLTNVELWIRLVLFVLILLSLFYHLLRHALLRCKSSWISFSLDQKCVLISTRGSAAVSGEILRRTVVTSYCVVLCIRPEGRKLAVNQVIFRDALQAEAFRELRVRLRFC